jgi:transposase InsO family protein
MHYGPPKKLLSANESNFLAGLVEHYLRKLGSKHKSTTPYHPQTNGKGENFNGMLGSMLTKYLANKSTMLWDLYLPQALFACRVRVHATTKRSPFFLLYGVHPQLPSDENPPRPLEIEITTEDHEKCIAQLHHARIEANELLLKRAI